VEGVLNDINAVVGVTGSFICNSEGQVLASALPDLFDETILSTVGRTMAQTIAGLTTARRRKISDIDLVYDQGRLIAKNLEDGCLCILCMRNINVPLLNLTANMAAKKLRAEIAKREELKSTEAIPEELTKALRAMSDFIEQLMGELGDKGTGRDDLLKAVEDRLVKLIPSYPLLRSVSITGNKVDLSPLLSKSLNARDLGEALGALIKETCYSVREISGPEAVEAQYRRIYDPFYRQNKVVLESLGLGQTLEKAATEEPPLPHRLWLLPYTSQRYLRAGSSKSEGNAK
jgi:predicted regulator of Ras-like GTPase activity (Roadblock/LC7/MglB family)